MGDDLLARFNVCDPTAWRWTRQFSHKADVGVLHICGRPRAAACVPVGRGVRTCHSASRVVQHGNTVCVRARRARCALWLKGV